MINDVISAFVLGVIVGILALCVIAETNAAGWNSDCIKAGRIGYAAGTALKGTYCVKTLAPDVVIVPLRGDK